MSFSRWSPQRKAWEAFHNEREPKAEPGAYQFPRDYYEQGHADATEALLGALPEILVKHHCGYEWAEHIVQVLREATT